MTDDTAKLSLTDEKKSSSSNVVKIAEDFILPRRIFEGLYPYQRDGVSWLWNLHKTAPGGILADDMGLGKTLQVCLFHASTLFSTRLLGDSL